MMMSSGTPVLMMSQQQAMASMQGQGAMGMMNMQQAAGQMPMMGMSPMGIPVSCIDNVVGVVRVPAHQEIRQNLESVLLFPVKESYSIQSLFHFRGFVLCDTCARYCV